MVSNGSNQSNMDSFVSRAKCPPTQAKRITELIALMVVKDLRPAAIVEGEGFKLTWNLGT